MPRASCIRPNNRRTPARRFAVAAGTRTLRRGDRRRDSFATLLFRAQRFRADRLEEVAEDAGRDRRIEELVESEAERRSQVAHGIRAAGALRLLQGAKACHSALRIRHAAAEELLLERPLLPLHGDERARLLPERGEELRRQPELQGLGGGVTLDGARDAVAGAVRGPRA